MKGYTFETKRHYVKVIPAFKLIRHNYYSNFCDLSIKLLLWYLSMRQGGETQNTLDSGHIAWLLSRTDTTKVNSKAPHL